MPSLFHLLTLTVLGALCVYGAGHLEQPQLSSTKKLSKTARLECVASGITISKMSVYWYQERPGEAMQHLLHILSNNTVRRESDVTLGKFEADKKPETSTSTLTIHNVQEQDAATYYCALWEAHSFLDSGLTHGKSVKVFGSGTQLIVTDRSLDVDMSPKPTIFLPSIDEINLHEAGTHLCLLEKFFPDVIKVYWKEKNGNRVLESQQGNIIKTNDTYMKFSWLTVTKRSMDNELVCIVKHQNNKRGVDQEILFPSIEKEVTTHACVKKGSDSLQLQLTNTFACYTYLLLLLKSLVYFFIISFCVCRRTAVCGHGKSS
ncbi:T-cell receptor gamma alternate reading frame protein [Phocoena phocoena]|uniref:T-cell receptor gamma alternate reading frame protein n=1 Tax=Phocoena phocoena TaxID=9742 RepID=UPI003306DF8E